MPRRFLLFGAALLFGWAGAAIACPFCTALAPTISQRREQADAVVLAEVIGPASGRQTELHVHQVLGGKRASIPAETMTVSLDAAVRPGSLVFLFGMADPAAAKDFTWHAVSASEAAVGYVAGTPPLKAQATERLRYFARFLENSEPLVAEDAYLEFGHASFDEVAAVADSLSGEKLKKWLVDPAVPPARKGFYGLALGLCTKSEERAANAQFLEGLIKAPADDFRAGFDGILGGFLLLAAEPGLELLETRLLANPASPGGDVRHALTAMRFYHEYGREIPTARLAQALRHLVSREEFAADVITDLARWSDWQALPQVVALYPASGRPQPATVRAIVGYLLACPLEQASKELERLRKQDPAAIRAAQSALEQTSSLPGDK